VSFVGIYKGHFFGLEARSGKKIRIYGGSTNYY